MGLGLNGLKEELLGESGGSKSEEVAIRDFVQFLVQGNRKGNQHMLGSILSNISIPRVRLRDPLSSNFLFFFLFFFFCLS